MKKMEHHHLHQLGVASFLVAEMFSAATAFVEASGWRVLGRMMELASVSLLTKTVEAIVMATIVGGPEEADTFSEGGLGLGWLGRRRDKREKEGGKCICYVSLRVKDKDSCL